MSGNNGKGSGKNDETLLSDPGNGNDDSQNDQGTPWRRTLILGIFFLVFGVSIFFFLFDFWPDDVEAASHKDLVLIVAFAGAMGSFVHAATSFASYVGNDRLVMSWGWWYILRPLIGSVLALIFYFVIRGGLLGMNNAEINFYGIVSIAALAGMFSKNAVDKLREVFDSLFKTEKGDDLRYDKLDESTAVRRRMIPREKIVACKMEQGQKDSDIKILDLYEMVKGVVTRVPVFSDNYQTKYVIHQSLLFRYIARKSVTDQTPFDAEHETLETFLKEGDNRQMIADAIAFVSIRSTVGQARAKMNQIKHCQDVFVTENGKRDEPVLGWLTNIELEKKAGE